MKKILLIIVLTLGMFFISNVNAKNVEQNSFTNDECISDTSWEGISKTNYSFNSKKGVFTLKGDSYNKNKNNFVYYSISSDGKILYAYIPNYNEKIKNNSIKTNIYNAGIISNYSCDGTLRVSKNLIGSVNVITVKDVKSKKKNNSGLVLKDMPNTASPLKVTVYVLGVILILSVLYFVLKRYDLLPDKLKNIKFKSFIVGLSILVIPSYVYALSGPTITNIAPSSLEANTISVSWNSNNNGDGYYIELYNKNDNTYNRFANSVNRYVYKGLKSGVTYKIKARVCSAKDICSSWTNEYEASTNNATIINNNGNNNNNNNKVTAIKFAEDASSLTLAPGQTKTLAIEVEPIGASGFVVAWSSSSPEVATIDQATGEITAVETGTTTITATVNGVSTSLALTVEEQNNKEIKDISITGDTKLEIGQLGRLKADFIPSDAILNGKIYWKIRDTSYGYIDDMVAACSLEGCRNNRTDYAFTYFSGDSIFVYGQKEGNLILDVQYMPCLGCSVPDIHKEVTVEITKSKATSISLDCNFKESDLLDPSTSSTYKCSLKDQNGNSIASSDVDWEIDDTSIATVNYGEITLKNKGGSTTLRATYDGVTAAYLINVKKDLSTEGGLMIHGYDSVKEGDKIQLGAWYSSGCDASGECTGLDVDVENEATWISSDTSVATVSNGVVTGVKAGTVTITAKYNGLTDTKTITVLPKVKSISLKCGLSGSVNLSSKSTSCSVVDQDGKTISSSLVTWSSSNVSVASVSSGTVSFKTGGAATITATYNGLVASAVFNISEPATKIVVTGSTNTLYTGGTLNLSYTKTPSTSTDNVSWTSSNTNVASIDQDGKVTARTEGTTTITARSTNSNSSAYGTYTITVKKANVVPTCNISVPSPSNSLKLTLSCTGTSITGYYFGTSSTATSYTTVSSVNSLSISNSPTVSGTYYLKAKDSSGQVSSPVSVTLYKVNFSMTNGTVSPTYVMGKAGSTYTLPTPTANSGYAINGNWYTNSALTTGAIAYGKTYTLSSNTTLYSGASSTPVSSRITGDDTVGVGGTLQLKTATSQQGVSWVSSDTSIATVSSTGKVTGKKAGVVEVKAWVSYNSSSGKVLYGTKTVYVMKLGAITKTASINYMYKSPHNRKLCTKVTPAAAASKVKWSLSASGAATIGTPTIDSSGNNCVVLTALKTRSSAFTVYAKDPTKKVSATSMKITAVKDCSVKVTCGKTTIAKKKSTTCTIDPNPDGDIVISAGMSGTYDKYVDLGGVTGSKAPYKFKVTGKKAGTVKIKVETGSSTDFKVHASKTITIKVTN